MSSSQNGRFTNNMDFLGFGQNAETEEEARRRRQEETTREREEVRRVREQERIAGSQHDSGSVATATTPTIASQDDSRASLLDSPANPEVSSTQRTSLRERAARFFKRVKRGNAESSSGSTRPRPVISAPIPIVGNTDFTFDTSPGSRVSNLLASHVTTTLVDHTNMAP